MVPDTIERFFKFEPIFFLLLLLLLPIYDFSLNQSYQYLNCCVTRGRKYIRALEKLIRERPLQLLKSKFTLEKSNRPYKQFPTDCTSLAFLRNSNSTRNNQAITKITCIVSRFLFFACTWRAFWAFNLPANLFLLVTIELFGQKGWNTPTKS